MMADAGLTTFLALTEVVMLAANAAPISPGWLWAFQLSVNKLDHSFTLALYGLIW